MNAIKFAPEGGKIGLEVNFAPDHDMVEFIVSDSGIGISRKNMKKLFKPFVQVDGSLSRKYGGTGLGLALVYRLVEMHGGSVKVESVEGQYSRFTVMLPWHPDNSELKKEYNIGASSESYISVSHARRARILMADDNRDNIETVAGYLKAKQYDVSFAYDGADAVTRACNENPDLILMDIQMPVMDGLEAIRQIRNTEYGMRNKYLKSEIKRVPIIALTALAMPGDREKCLEAGADEYLSKPVGFKLLIEMIEKLLGREA